MGGAGGGAGDDPEGAFEKSLGDFDGEIAREREAMASAGRGSGGAAASRESGDASAVKSSGQRGGAMSGAGGAGGMAGTEGAGDEGGGLGGEPADAGTSAGAAGDAEAGGGQQAPGAAEGAGSAGSQQKGEAAPDIPDDIPADGTGEDQVAKQLREAAMAEKDPAVREALWEQYRRHTGIRK